MANKKKNKSGTNKTWGEFYRREYTKSDLFRFTRSYLKYFDYILNSKAETILEVGIGSGMHTILLSLLGFEITGIDNDEEILKRAEKYNREWGGKAKILKMDGFDLKFPSKGFDLVISEGLLEHFTDKEIGQLLKEQLRVGKEVAISVPSIGYPNRDFGDERLIKKEKWLDIIKRELPAIKILKAEYDGFRVDTIPHFILTGKIFSLWRWRYKPRILIVIKE